MMVRRDFLVCVTAGGVSAAAGGGKVFAYTPKKRHAPSPPPKLDRIAISTWSLHNYFRATRESDSTLPGPLLALLDVPELIADRYRVHHLEFCASQFPSTEQAYVREMKYTLTRARSTLVNLVVDIKECGREGTFSDPDPGARAAAIDAVKPWIDIAHALGARSVRVSPGKVDAEDLEPSAASYKVLAAYALARGVLVLVENLGDFGADNPEELVKLFQLTGPGRLGALPDLGNFADGPTRQKGLKLLFPYASSVCHAKGLEFDASGVETAYDFPQAVEISKHSAFRGLYSIEFEGSGDPYQGVQKTLDELLKYL